MGVAIRIIVSLWLGYAEAATWQSGTAHGRATRETPAEWLRWLRRWVKAREVSWILTSLSSWPRWAAGCPAKRICLKKV
eukprot:7120776-Karenia_brevis.AAC.1